MKYHYHFGHFYYKKSWNRDFDQWCCQCFIFKQPFNEISFFLLTAKHQETWRKKHKQEFRLLSVILSMLSTSPIYVVCEIVKWNSPLVTQRLHSLPPIILQFEVNQSSSVFESMYLNEVIQCILKKITKNRNQGYYTRSCLSIFHHYIGTIL